MTEFEHTSLASAYTEFLNASPLDIISLMPGDYTNTVRKNLTKTTSGLVTFRSKYPGQARIFDEPIDLGTQFTIFSGFDMRYDNANMEINAPDCTVERNKFFFDPADTANHWLEVKHPRSTVQNNEFKNMTSGNNAIYVHNSVSSGVVPRDCRVLNNYIHDFSASATPMTIGFSGVAARDLSCEVAGNRFERCNGDDEIMSIKSSNNYIHDNTIVESQGSLTLRQCNTCIVDNNILIDCGIRMYGNGHTITRNQILRDSQATFRQSLVVGMGDLEDYPAPSDTGNANYGRTKNCVIEFNIIDAEDAAPDPIFVWGWPSGTVHDLPPQNNTVRYNEIYASAEQMVDLNDTTHGASWSGNLAEKNILHATGTATYGDVTGFGYVDVDLRRYKRYDGSYRCAFVRQANDVGVLAYP